MSQLSKRQFEVLTGAKSPFLPQEDSDKKGSAKGVKKGSKKGSERNKKGPSGSTWNESHLNWLHVLCEAGYDLMDIFSQESELPQSSKIATSLREDLKGEWYWICNNDHKASNSIFGCLQALILEREENDAFNTHSNTQSSTKHRTPPSAKSQSVTPQQHRGGTQDTLREFERTPTPLQRQTWVLDPQLHMPELLSRKRQREENRSPQRECGGTMIAPGHTEDSRSSQQQRGGSPIPQRQDTKTPSHQLKSPATPSHLMRPPNSPLDHRQQDPKPPSPPDRFEPPSNKQSSVTGQHDLQTPGHEVKIQTASFGQKPPFNIRPRIQSGGAPSSIVSQHRISQFAIHDGEENSDEGEDDEDTSGEDDEEEGEDAGGASEAASHDKSEEDVKAAGRAFLALVHDAIKNTKNGVEPKRVAEQSLVLETRDPRPHHIQIDKTDVSTHPDLVLQLVFGKIKQRKKIGVVLEFKKRDHKLNDEEILGQEVSELLGAVLEKKAARKQKSYKSYLISWHGLKGYISRFYATKEYLNQLQENSRGLQDMDPPQVRRSEEFDLTKSEERVNFAIGCARIAVEELLQFERNQTSGLLERIRA